MIRYVYGVIMAFTLTSPMVPVLLTTRLITLNGAIGHVLLGERRVLTQLRRMLIVLLVVQVQQANVNNVGVVCILILAHVKHAVKHMVIVVHNVLHLPVHNSLIILKDKTQEIKLGRLPQLQIA